MSGYPPPQVFANLVGTVAEHNGSLKALIATVRLLSERVERLEADLAAAVPSREEKKTP